MQGVRGLPGPAQEKHMQGLRSANHRGGEDDEAGAMALVPKHGPPQKRQKTVLIVSALLVPGDAGGVAASGSHFAIAAVGVPKASST